MKKLIIGLTLATAVLTGCNNATGDVIDGKNGNLTDVGDLGKGYDLIRDSHTGCVYIQEAYKSEAQPLTPYFGEDGKVVGCGKKDLDKSKYK